MERTVKHLILTLAVATLVAASFFGGVVADRYVEHRARVSASAQGEAIGETVDEVRQLLDREALEPGDEESMTAGAINGLLEGLDDPYAMYFDARHLAYFNEQNDGAFDGIGITITGKDGKAYVVSVFKGTPAESAGVKADDEIVAIDDVRRDKWDIDEVVKRIRGEAGTVVKIEVRRKDVKDPITMSITRAKIDLPNTEYEMKGRDVGYIRLMSFNKNATDEVRAAVKELEDKGAKGFVLDLRDNPGGMLEQAVRVASLFVSDGVIVRVDERNRPEVEHRATGDTVTDAPLVVLVNGQSASASEIVAAALQDYDRATLVGEKTFGKGSVQTIRELSRGGAVKFTVAHYLSPKKTVIDKKGVQPDVVVVLTPEEYEKTRTDTQLDRALRVVRGQL